MDPVQIIGWVGIFAAAVVLMSGLYTLLGELAFRARWKWGDAHKLKRSAKLGWNTGTPPEGAMFLVLEYADQLAKHADFISEHRWAVMTRRGDECRSINGGMTTPVTNVTGWLEITT